CLVGILPRKPPPILQLGGYYSFAISPASRSRCHALSNTLLPLHMPAVPKACFISAFTPGLPGSFFGSFFGSYPLSRIIESMALSCTVLASTRPLSGCPCVWAGTHTNGYLPASHLLTSSTQTHG